MIYLQQAACTFVLLVAYIRACRNFMYGLSRDSSVFSSRLTYSSSIKATMTDSLNISLEFSNFHVSSSASANL